MIEISPLLATALQSWRNGNDSVDNDTITAIALAMECSSQLLYIVLVLYLIIS
jgi:hypothetical protein